MNEPYNIINIDGWPQVYEETLGTKEKFWARDPETGKRWLFKFNRLSAGQIVGDDWAEKIGAELAGVLGLPHAVVELAQYGDRFGVISLEGVLEGADAVYLRRNRIGMHPCAKGVSPVTITPCTRLRPAYPARIHPF